MQTLYSDEGCHLVLISEDTELHHPVPRTPAPLLRMPFDTNHNDQADSDEIGLVDTSISQCPRLRMPIPDVDPNVANWVMFLSCANELDKEADSISHAVAAVDSLKKACYHSTWPFRLASAGGKSDANMTSEGHMNNEQCETAITNKFALETLHTAALDLVEVDPASRSPMSNPMKWTGPTRNEDAYAALEGRRNSSCSSASDCSSIGLSSEGGFSSLPNSAVLPPFQVFDPQTIQSFMPSRAFEIEGFGDEVHDLVDTGRVIHPTRTYAMARSRQRAYHAGILRSPWAVGEVMKPAKWGTGWQHPNGSTFYW